MSRPVRDKMLDLDKDLDRALLPPAAAIRAYGQRRARRRTTAAVVAVTAAIVGGGVAGAMTFSPPRTALPYGDRAVPEASCTVPSYPLDLTMPNIHTIEVRVLDGAGDAQRAASVAQQLRVRGFAADAATPTGSPGDDKTAKAQLRYGPSAVGAAQVLKAFVDGPVTMRFDPDRAGRTVDIVIGASFAVRTPTEVNQTLVAEGQPTAPATVCGSGRPGR